MAKSEQIELVEIHAAEVASIERFLSVALLTPLVNPEIGQHPRDPIVRWGVNTNLVGLSGVGKSDVVGSTCRRIGIDMFPVFAATKQPEDFSGAIVPTPQGIVIECILPAARAAINNGGGCIFVDEISDARPATLAAMHSFLNDRRAGDHPLPPRTRFITAMNPAEYATAGHGLSPAMANRTAHVKFPPPTRTKWCNWAEGNLDRLISIGAGENKVIENWNTHMSTSVSLVTKFMEKVEDEMLHNQPKPDDPHSEGAWNSPRTWWWFVCARNTVACLGESRGLELEMAEALLGPGPKDAWAEHLEEAALTSPLDMVAGKWNPNKLRLDITDMSLRAMVGYLRDVAKEDRAQAIGLAVGAWQQIEKTVDVGLADLVVKPANVLLRAKLGRKKTNDQVAEIAERIIDRLTADGYSKFSE
jgi:hypothetical protein